MRLHYKGKYDLNPDSLPHGEHMPNAVPFKEAKDSKTLGIIANVLGIGLMIILLVPVYIRYHDISLWLGAVLSLLTLFPHELLHGVCFKEDVYLYTNLNQGMLFVVGPETMTKRRFVLMSLLPNIVFGFIPYALGMIFPALALLSCFGAICIGMGAGDYYNVFNALTQMPKGAKTYLYKFNSYWYMP